MGIATMSQRFAAPAKSQRFAAPAKARRLAALLAGAALCGTLATAQQPAQQPTPQPAQQGAQQPAPRPASLPPPLKLLYKMPAVYSVPGEEQVQVRRDIVYKTVESPAGKLELKLDVYTPREAKPDERFPAVVLISGGGAGERDWRDSGVYISYGKILGASGFTAVTFSKRYERAMDDAVKLEDFHDLVGYVRSHAAELHVNADNMAFWAFSGGGLLLGPVVAEMQAYARAVVCFYCVAGVDFPLEGANSKMSEKLSLTAQIENAPGTVPPIFVGRAGLDSADLNRNLDRFVAEAIAKNLLIEVMNHPTGRHGFDIIDANARSREIIQRALEFLRTHLGEN
jgi:acetyl esterase/lipase